MSQTIDLYDITIIGGGPAGLFAAFYAGLRQAKTKIIDSRPEIGGQLTALYPEKYIYDAPGQPAIKAADLIANLKNQLASFEQTIVLEEEVVHLDQKENYLQLKTTKGTHYSKAVIFAIGKGAFQPRRLTLSGAQRLENRGIYYHVKDIQAYKNQDVVILGGGDSAIDWALTLAPIAKSVSLVHRRSTFRAHEHSVSALERSEVKLFTPYTISELDLQESALKGLYLKQPQGEKNIYLKADALIVNFGFSSSLPHLQKWRLNASRQSIPVTSDMSTNLPGVYAIGDIADYEGKVKLIATGFGEAPIAVNNAMHYIMPDTRIQPGHSTSLFEPESKK